MDSSVSFELYLVLHDRVTLDLKHRGVVVHEGAGGENWSSVPGDARAVTWTEEGPVCRDFRGARRERRGWRLSTPVPDVHRDL